MGSIDTLIVLTITLAVIGLRRLMSGRLQATTLIVLYAAYFVGSYVTILTLLPWRQIAHQALK